MGLLQRIRGRIRHTILARELGGLGRASVIDDPDMLTGASGVFLGDHVTIRGHSRIECVMAPPYRGEIRIGDGTVAQFYFHCGAAKSVTIGKKVLIAGRVYVTDHDHAWPDGGTALVTAPVVIGDGCWLGEGCAILKGVTLGEACVVGANAVVTRSAPARSMLVGVPARVVKRYDPRAGRWLAAEPEGRPEPEG